MKHIFLGIFLVCNCLALQAQETMPLNTPFYWLRDARNKASANDTSGTFFSLMNSVKYGLFDTAPVLKNKLYGNLLSSLQLEQIRSGIVINRKKMENPSAIQIYTEDIDRFWKSYPLRSDTSFASNLFANYILEGTVGLKTFYQIRMNNKIDDLAKKVRQSSKFYASINEVTAQFGEMKPQFVAAAKELERLYPESIFPPIYFIIGYLNNVGTADGYAGLLIGTEHLCKFSLTDTSELTDIDKMVLFDTSLTVPLIIHEYVHFQQNNKTEATLLELSVMEGVADFITYLISGRYTNPEVYEYGFKNEGEIWRDFSDEMQNENIDKWLFNAYDPKTGYPGNLGYFIGFRICESYYKKSADKSAAIRELLNIKDLDRLLSTSQYRGMQ